MVPWHIGRLISPRTRSCDVTSDRGFRTTSRIATVAALVAFLAWIVWTHPVLLLLALVLGVAAYGSFLADQRLHPVELGMGIGRDTEDRVRKGSREAVSPGLSIGGIHMTYEKRSRWRRR